MLKKRINQLFEIKGEIKMKVEIQDTVQIHYKLELENGTTFESTCDREPVEFKVGHNEILPSVDRVLLDMKQGDSKKITVPYEKAFGPYRKDLVIEIDREEYPYPEPEIGQMLKIANPTENSSQQIARVIDFSESTVILDSNHLLAGKNLTFHIQIVKVIKDTK